MSRSRLTITLSKDVLQLIDHIIDGKNFRNRSHAIESLLLSQLRGSISQAIILGGGGPSGLQRSLTPISGQPLILHSINLLKSYGVKNIFILVDSPPTSLESVISKCQGVNLVKQRPHLGTARAIYQLRQHISTKPFIVMHGDIFTDINFKELMTFHLNHNSLATICVKPKLNKKEFGKVIIQGTKIKEFHSSPLRSEVGMINTGVYLFNSQLISELKSSKKTMLETAIFPKLAQKNQLSGYIFEGIWYEVSKTN